MDSKRNKQRPTAEAGRARRTFLRTAVFGAGLVGLRSLATGLPIDFLRSRSIAHAADGDTLTPLIISHSGAGDPLNANCPGTYTAGPEHNPNPALAPVDFQLGRAATRAAAPWANLTDALRSRMCFFHHGTYVNAHPEMSKVMTGLGAVTEEDSNSTTMLASMVSSHMAGPLGTTQTEPISMGRDRVTFQGRPLDLIQPTDLQGLFATPEALAAELRMLRDRELDTIYGELKTSGTPAQRAFLDRYALGREQASNIGSDLAALLSRVPTDPDNANSATDQIICAVALIKLNVAPVVTLNIPFGGDNHNDTDLTREEAETVSGVAALQFLYDELTAANLAESVTFASLNVFGRTLKRNAAGGRNHNGDHHALCMFGPKLQGSVIGGIEATKRDFGATAINSTSGASDPAGDVGKDATFESALRTLGAAVGLTEATLDATINGGTVIGAALA